MGRSQVAICNGKDRWNKRMNRVTEQLELAGLDESPRDHRLVVNEDQISRLRRIGITYQDGFITASEEKALLQAIDAAPWITDLRRRVQHYGYRYDYTRRSISEHDRIEPLPDWVIALAKRLSIPDYMEAMPDQLIVNEYEPGQGIAPHIDRDCFGPRVAAVSIGGDCLIDLKSPDDKKDGFSIAALRRSLMIYTGEGRAKWKHGISARFTDQQDGKKIKRTRRVSLTFRTVLHLH